MFRATQILRCGSLAAAAVALAHAATAQCTGPFTGGIIPAAGTGGPYTYPTTMPPSPSVFTAAVTVPGGATVLKSVKLNGLSHTWGGDAQFVLTEPGGTMHNLANAAGVDPNVDWLGGNYELFDAVNGLPCGTVPAGFFTAGAPAPGSYIQEFGGWPNGTNGINNTPLEQIPISSGTWTLTIFDWVGGDVGTLTNFELCFGSPTPPLPPTYPGSEACVTGGTGAAYPSGGVDGVWPTTLPTGELISPASITVPAGATKVVGVKLIGWNHTWVTDSMVVLDDPSGGRHLIYQNDNGSGCGGCADDLGGDYEFVDMVAGAGSPCAGGNAAFPTCGVGAINPGRYLQEFGAWPTGSSGINNTLIESIPVSSGTWTLTIYDWCVGFDNGSLVGWDLCFDVPTGPTSYCLPTAPGTSNSCVPTIGATGNPNVAHSNSCVITVSSVEGQKSGIIFYGLAPATTNWCGGGFGNSMLCVKAPTQRTPTQSSGGTAGSCNGSLVLNWNAFQTANPGALGNPWSAGTHAYVQGWFRDPPSCKTTFLSEALDMTYVP